MERLLRTPEFKSLIVKELKAVAPQIQKENILDWTTKLELGVIALLYCRGSLEDKAQFFYDLANPNDIMREGEVKGVAWSDDELKFIFVKLLQFATDMPERYKNAFKVLGETGSPASFDDSLDYEADLYSYEEAIYCAEEELSQLDQLYGEEAFFDRWLLDPFFGSDSMLSKDVMLERFKTV